MADFASPIATYDCEQHVFAAAQHIVKALGASKNLNDDVRRLLADLDTHLSTMTIITETESRGTRELEEQLKFAQQKIMSLESNRAMIWASGHEVASEYLQAVYEIHRLSESLRSLLSNRSGKQKELLEQAHIVLQIAMERLEEELILILAQNKQSFEPENMSFRSCEDDVVYEESIASNEDDLIEDTPQRDSSSTEPEERIIDLVHPEVISYIKSIADVMFALRYDQEFCHAFINFWKDELDEYFAVLRCDKLSIEDLLKMEWRCLNRKIKKWIRAMKFIIRVCLASEKRLFGQVLGEFGSVCSTCFVEATKGAMLCLLNFGEAMAISPLRPEKLLSLLDMYEVLADLLPDIDSLFSEDVGSFVRTEFHELLMRLGGTARATFMEFGNAVASNTSTNPFPGGGIHHLTKYVMNYIHPIFEYASTLNLLLGVQVGEEMVEPIGTVDWQNISLKSSCPVARHLRWLTSNLESSLDNKSRLYKDGSLKHIFMMNNIHYMVRKVQGSELAIFFGDEWIRDYTGKFQQHATSYERVTWNPVLCLLRDDGNLGKSILRERYRGFQAAFEEVYRNQAGWFIPDLELRKDLRISTSQKVIPAYRAFSAKSFPVIGDKYIKYSADDLEDHILNLFEGSSISLHSTRKR
ncbi:hypothetical protein CsSME_00006682 [Camellia sinensis var. sinensis]